MNAFPTSLVAPELSAEKVTEALKSNYTKYFLASASSTSGSNSSSSLGDDYLDIVLDNLDSRFAYMESVMHDLGVAIPDQVLSTLTTINDVQNYYLTKVVAIQFNEKLPDAIYLDPNDFEGMNITIVDVAQERREKRAKWKSLLKEAKQAQVINKQATTSQKALN